MNDHTPHQSLVAVQTDGPHRIIVEPVEPTGKPGAWFRMWESTVFSGLLARLSGGEVRLFWAIAAHHQRGDGHLCIAPESALCQYTGRSLYQIRTARRALCSRDGGRICVHHGGDVYELMPEEPLLGRRQAITSPDRGRAWPLIGGDGENPTHELGKPNGRLGNPHAALPPLRARAKTSQPEEEKDRSGFETNAREASGRLTVASLERFAKARAQGMAGWKGFPLWWSLEGVECPRLAMGMLEVREPIRGAVLAIGEQTMPITVPEIARHAEAIVNDPTAQKPAVILCWRLCKDRGHDLPVSNATAKRRDARTAGLEELRERRVQEAVRAAGGGR